MDLPAALSGEMPTKATAPMYASTPTTACGCNGIIPEAAKVTEHYEHVLGRIRKLALPSVLTKG